MKPLYLIIPTVLLAFIFGFQNPEKPLSKSSEQAAQAWADSVFNAMTADERLGQLMMVRAHSNKGADHVAKVEKLIKEYHLGGLCFFQGTPEKQVQLINRFQKLNRHVPMMISMDAEWGLGMRFKKDGMSYPKQLMLGAIQDNRLIYDMGKDIARQLRRVGTQVNFAPVVDVNNNPNNPVINTRSFGEDRYNVAAKSYMYMRGMQDGNVMACAKHFPGHGDTDVDSHLDLPVISHDRNRLDSIELLPFRVLAEHGIQSMMIAHLHVPIIDARPNIPTTLSSNAIDTILKKEFRFDGLIFTDGLGMKGVSKHHKNGEVEAKALAAGNDVLLLPEDVGAAFKVIKQYIAEGKLSQAKVDASVKKILRSKYKLGLTRNVLLKEHSIRTELETPEAIILRRKLIENALTLVRNQDNLVPIKETRTQTIATLSIGASSPTDFQKTISKYATLDHYQVGKDISSSRKANLLANLSKKDIAIVSLHDMSDYSSKDFGFTKSLKNFITELNQRTKVILVVFGTPYSLKYFDAVDHVLMAYTEQMETEEITAHALFGATSIRGKLPVTASAKSKFNDGVNTIGIRRMGYSIPAAVGMNVHKLYPIDTLMQEAIKTKATPGGVVLVAKDGKIVFEKAYGYHTYDKKKAVSVTDVYDLASITKIAASTLAVMKLSEEGKINIDLPMSQYLPALQNTNKAAITTREMMTHHSGLKAWFKFYENTLSGSKKNPRPSSKYYKKSSETAFSIPVANNLYLQTGYEDTIRQTIYDSELRSSKNYKYSDLGFYLVADMVKAVTGKSLDIYMHEAFYGPMGLETMTFKPSRKFGKDRTPPTERDNYFRRQTIQGHVHDMGSAMMGGVSGHAGLFSNARDLAALMQLLLNGGQYAGKQYLNPSTINTFTQRCAGCTRRAVGFDMKQLDGNLSENMSPNASANTFGHLGFTGTCVWVDPDQNLVYVLLSNRTFPSMFNYKFSRENYRPKIQSVVYESLNSH